MTTDRLPSPTWAEFEDAIRPARRQARLDALRVAALLVVIGLALTAVGNMPEFDLPGYLGVLLMVMGALYLSGHFLFFSLHGVTSGRSDRSLSLALRDLFTSAMDQYDGLTVVPGEQTAWNLAARTVTLHALSRDGDLLRVTLCWQADIEERDLPQGATPHRGPTILSVREVGRPAIVDGVADAEGH